MCQWAETGAPEAQRAFDMALIELCLRQDLNGGATLLPNPDGLRMTLRMKL